MRLLTIGLSSGSTATEYYEIRDLEVEPRAGNFYFLVTEPG
ncbi:MAG: hypothetical protein ACI9HY_001505 [Planctomycetaceae bacterium]|jgi:hypothetical protein